MKVIQNKQGTGAIIPVLVAVLILAGAYLIYIQVNDRASETGMQDTQPTTTVSNEGNTNNLPIHDGPANVDIALVQVEAVSNTAEVTDATAIGQEIDLIFSDGANEATTSKQDDESIGDIPDVPVTSL